MTEKKTIKQIVKINARKASYIKLYKLSAQALSLLYVITHCSPATHRFYQFHDQTIKRVHMEHLITIIIIIVSK